MSTFVSEMKFREPTSLSKKWHRPRVCKNGPNCYYYGNGICKFDHSCNCFHCSTLHGSSKVECSATVHDCVCNYRIECKSVEHKCVCDWRGWYKTVMCKSDTHQCTCRDKKHECRSAKHECICSLNRLECRSHIHENKRECTCDMKFFTCQSVNHKCVCLTGFICKSTEHKCVCDCIGYITVTCKSDKHRCTCSDKSLECRSENHNCVCGSELDCRSDVHECTCYIDEDITVYHIGISPECRASSDHKCMSCGRNERMEDYSICYICFDDLNWPDHFLDVTKKGVVRERSLIICHFCHTAREECDYKVDEEENDLDLLFCKYCLPQIYRCEHCDLYIPHNNGRHEYAGDSDHCQFTGHKHCSCDVCRH